MDLTFASSYLVLIVGTLITLSTIILGWYMLRSPEFVVMPALMYYYTLFGAWQILGLKTRGDTTDALYHLEASLATVQVNSEYTNALATYSFFLLLFSIGILLGSRRMPTLPAEDVSDRRIASLLTIATVAGVGSLGIIWTELKTALQQGASVYLLTRGDYIPLFSIHQLLNRVVIIALALAWVQWLTTPSEHYRSMLGSLVLAGITIASVAYLGMLGNRNEIMLGAIGGFYLFFFLGGRIQKRVLLTLGLLSYIALRSIEILRAQPLDLIVPELIQAMATTEFWDPSKVVGGSESLAAHVSLYNLFSEYPDWTYGSSLLYLVESLIPFFPKESRIADTYQVYADAIRAPGNQGFNIHFVAGSWLNGGILAVIAFTFILIAMFRLLRRLTLQQIGSNTRCLPFLTGYAFMCAMLPLALRSGPEGLKALFFEGFAIPCAVAILGMVRVPSHHKP